MRAIASLLTIGILSTLSPGEAVARQNQPPNTPSFTEPLFDGRVVNAADVHMECTLFSDPNPGDTHLCTDWEIWTITPPERVWVTSCITGVERLHTHLGDGQFENSHEGQHTLRPSTSYRLRVRHQDSSGAPNSWSAWGERLFETAPPTQVNPLEVDDFAASPEPQWTVGLEPVVLGSASPAAYLRVETGMEEPYAEIRSLNNAANQVIDHPGLSAHHPIRIRISSGGWRAAWSSPSPNCISSRRTTTRSG